MGSNPYEFAFDLVAFQRSLFIYDIYEPQVTKKTVFSLDFCQKQMCNDTQNYLSKDKYVEL